LILSRIPPAYLYAAKFRIYILASQVFPDKVANFVKTQNFVAIFIKREHKSLSENISVLPIDK